MRAREFLIENPQAVQKVFSQRMWPQLSKYVQAGMQKVGANIEDKTNMDAELKQYVTDYLIPIDPSKSGGYSPTLIKWFGNGEFIPSEDSGQITMLLKQFEQFKNKLPVEQRDLTKMSKADLTNAINTLVQADRKAALATQKHEHQASDNAHLGDVGKVLINDGDFIVVVPQSKEQARNASAFPEGAVYGRSNQCYANAPDKAGRTTSWCTLSTSNWEHYHNQGPLYNIIVHRGDPAKQRMFQLQYESNQFKDEDDNEIGQDEIALLSQFPSYTKLLNSLIKKHYSKYFENA